MDLVSFAAVGRSYGSQCFQVISDRISLDWDAQIPCKETASCDNELAPLVGFNPPPVASLDRRRPLKAMGRWHPPAALCDSCAGALAPGGSLLRVVFRLTVCESVRRSR